MEVIKIYAVECESCLVGEFVGSLDDSVKHIQDIADKHGFKEGVQRKTVVNEDGTEARIDFDYKENRLSTQNPLWEKVSDVAEELMEFGDVRGDYPTTYILEKKEVKSGYSIIGSFFS